MAFAKRTPTKLLPQCANFGRTGRPQERPAAARKALRAIIYGTTEVVPLHFFAPKGELFRKL
jgi:hypothetical protein